MTKRAANTAYMTHDSVHTLSTYGRPLSPPSLPSHSFLSFLFRQNEIIQLSPLFHIFWSSRRILLPPLPPVTIAVYYPLTVLYYQW